MFSAAACCAGPCADTAALRAFNRLAPAPNSGHSGLGLALVSRLVEAAGGTLAAQCAPGGFAISVRLPLP